MAQDDRRRLAAAVRRWEAAKFPRSVRTAALRDAYVDLAEEDGYLMGLCLTYLRSGSLEVERISVDRTIDDRIAALRARKDSPELARVAAYRLLMLDAAQLLAQATGLVLSYVPGTQPS
jgi:hypothetical protein